MPERRWRVMGRGPRLLAFDVDDSGGSARRRRPKVDAALRQRERDVDAAERAGDVALADDFRCTWWR